MQSRHRVWRCVPHARCSVEHNHAVTDSRGNTRVGHSALKWKQTLPNHLCELRKYLGIRSFKLPWPTCIVDHPFTRQHCDDASFVTHWNCEHVGRTIDGLHENLTLHRSVRLDALVEQNSLGVTRPRIYIVRVIQSLPSCRTHLGADEPAFFANWYVEQHVGKTKVGQHSPFGDQCRKMLDCALLEVCVFVG